MAAVSKLPLEQRFIAGLGLLKELTKSTRVCLIDLANGDEPRIRQNVGIDAPRMDPHILRATSRIATENSARSDQFRQQQKRFALITVPLISKGTIDSCLSVIKEIPTPVDLDSLMTTIQLFAVHFYGMESEKERQRESRASLRIAGFAEAMEKAASADDFPECAAQLAESFRDLAECERVALATIRYGSVRIQAISGVPSSETMRSEGATAIETLMKTAVRENRIIELDNQANSLQMPEMSSLGAGKILCAPLIHQEKITGAWVFLWKQQPLDIEERVRFLR
ncbi:MAG: hypothetical protein P1V20_30240, partial [Verrucomicrobiales bacterium]|nr:hypothetical protein [Verrucomicrobiales bacterium]